MHAALPLTALLLWLSGASPAPSSLAPGSAPRHAKRAHALGSRSRKGAGAARGTATPGAPATPPPVSAPEGDRAAGGPAQLAITEPSAPVSLTALSGQVAQWVTIEARAQGLRVLGPDEVNQLLGEQDYAQLQSCRGQPACVRSFAARLHVPRLVVGTLDKDEQSYTVHLLLMETGGKRISELDRVVRIATRRLGEEVRAGTAAFLKGRSGTQGVLRLVSEVPGAAVSVDGASAGLTPLTVSLSPGRHEVEVEEAGRLPVHRWVSISGGQTTQESVRLLAIPGTEPVRLPSAGSEGALTPSATSGSAGEGGYRVPVATWVAGGLAVAALDVGLYYGITSWKIENGLRAGHNATLQTYAGTRALALAGRRDAIAADVLFAAAGAAALTALGFALFSPQAPLHAQLSATPQSASVSMGGTF